MSGEQEGEKGFRIVDKRGAGGDKKPTEPEAPTEQEKQASEGPQPGGEAQAVEAVDVYGVLRYCIALLHSHAWQTMGLVPNPVTNQIERDLEQARVAIDCLGFLAEKLESKADAEERASLRGLLTDLRINFAHQQERAT